MLLRSRTFPMIALPASRRLGLIVAIAFLALAARTVLAQDLDVSPEDELVVMNDETTTVTADLTTTTTAAAEEARQLRRVLDEARRAFAQQDLDRLRDSLDDIRTLDPEHPLVTLYGQAFHASEIDPEVLRLLDFPRPDSTTIQTDATPDDDTGGLGIQTDKGPLIREQLGMGRAVTGPIPGGSGFRHAVDDTQEQGGLMDRIKAQPLWVWIVLGVALLAIFLFLRRRGGDQEEATASGESDTAQSSSDDILAGAGSFGAAGGGIADDISFSIDDEEEDEKPAKPAPATREPDEDLADVSLFADLDEPSIPQPKSIAAADEDSDLGLDLSDINLFDDNGVSDDDSEEDGKDDAPTTLDELENPLDFDDDDRP